MDKKSAKHVKFAKNIAKKISCYLPKNKITYAGLAEKTGIPVAALKNRANTAHEIGIDALAGIARHLNIGLPELLSEEEETLNRAGRGYIAKELLKKLSQKSLAEKRRFYNILKIL